MSTENADKQTQHAGTSVSPSAADTQRLFLRLTFWQTVLSVVGVFIAVVALYAALAESSAVRQQTAAAVWPYAQLQIEDYDVGDEAGFTIMLRNAGVGPAKIRAVQLVIEGDAMSDWDEVIRRLDGSPEGAHSRNFINRRVLSPDESVELFATMEPALVRRLRSAIAEPETFMQYCYCSIFDDCWLADSRTMTAGPEAVEACPDYGSGSFLY